MMAGFGSKTATVVGRRRLAAHTETTAAVRCCLGWYMETRKYRGNA